jgi:transposase
MGTARRQYTDEFKREALGLLGSSGRPLSQIAGELGIPAARLRAWRNRNGGGQTGSPRRLNTQAAIPPDGMDLARDVPGLRLVRRHGRLCGRILCLARPARKPTQGGQSRLA